MTDLEPMPDPPRARPGSRFLGFLAALTGALALTLGIVFAVGLSVRRYFGGDEAEVAAGTAVGVLLGLLVAVGLTLLLVVWLLPKGGPKKIKRS